MESAHGVFSFAQNLTGWNQHVNMAGIDGLAHIRPDEKGMKLHVSLFRFTEQAQQP